MSESEQKDEATAPVVEGSTGISDSVDKEPPALFLPGRSGDSSRIGSVRGRPGSGTRQNANKCRKPFLV